MPIEGCLLIDFYPVAGRANRVRIRSSRPRRAARVFEGKTPLALLMQLPLLFSVCGIAQTTAAVQAFRQARAEVGVPVRDGEKDPVAVQHIVRCFDPCMVSTVH